MITATLEDAIPLPLVGSFGYLRGTGLRAQVLQRNAQRSPDGHETCLVKLFELARGIWLPVQDAHGNRTVERHDLFATQDEAVHCGRKPRRPHRSTRRI